jgi:hypothetical protein
VERLNPTASEFKSKGLKSYGVIEASDLGRAHYYLEDMGLDSPQTLDRQRLAAKYSADTMKGTTLVLDELNRIMVVSSDLAAIREAVAILLAP